MKKTYMFSIALVMVLALFAVTPMVSAQEAGGCAPEGRMECTESSDGCSHKTCVGGTWGSEVSFSDPATGGVYDCATNPHSGGGQRCSFKKSYAVEMFEMLSHNAENSGIWQLIRP